MTRIGEQEVFHATLIIDSTNLRSGSIFVSLWKLHSGVRKNAWEPLKLGLISGYDSTNGGSSINRRGFIIARSPTEASTRRWRVFIKSILKTGASIMKKMEQQTNAALLIFHNTRTCFEYACDKHSSKFCTGFRCRTTPVGRIAHFECLWGADARDNEE